MVGAIQAPAGFSYLSDLTITSSNPRGNSNNIDSWELVKRTLLYAIPIFGLFKLYITTDGRNSFEWERDGSSVKLLSSAIGILIGSGVILFTLLVIPLSPQIFGTLLLVSECQTTAGIFCGLTYKSNQFTDKRNIEDIPKKTKFEIVCSKLMGIFLYLFPLSSILHFINAIYGEYAFDRIDSLAGKIKILHNRNQDLVEYGISNCIYFLCNLPFMFSSVIGVVLGIFTFVWSVVPFTLTTLNEIEIDSLIPSLTYHGNSEGCCYH